MASVDRFRQCGLVNRADLESPDALACPDDRENQDDPVNPDGPRKRADRASPADHQKQAARAIDRKPADGAAISQFRRPCRCRRSLRRSGTAIDVNLDLRKIANSAR